jgi:putative membrane protein
VSPPNEPTKKHKADRDRLSKLSGDNFDREFAKMMVEDHKKDIRGFETEAKKKNDPVAEFANETLPTLRKHPEMAQSLANGRSASR